MTDYDKVRQLSDCPLCGRSKLKGVLLCWFCHHKSASNSPYRVETLKKLDEIERSLTPETAQSPKGVVLNSRTHKPR